MVQQHLSEMNKRLKMEMLKFEYRSFCQKHQEKSGDFGINVQLRDGNEKFI